MTRTQKLGLCTWLPEDPVCLAEVNDNFSRLDTSGARALRQAEAGLIALGGVMAAQAHQGGHAAYSDSIQADAFSDMEQVADYTGVYFLNQCGELLTEGVSDGTVFGNAADNAFNASGISRATQVTQTWVKLFSFYPDAYGTLSTLKLQSVATTGSTTTAVKLAIWDSATHESLLETELATMTRSGGTDDPITFNTPFLLDPNRKYDMMLWIESMAASTFTLKSIVFSVTPVIYQEGSVSLNARAIPSGCTHAEILLTPRPKPHRRPFALIPVNLPRSRPPRPSQISSPAAHAARCCAIVSISRETRKPPSSSSRSRARAAKSTIPRSCCCSFLPLRALTFG